MHLLPPPCRLSRAWQERTRIQQGHARDPCWAADPVSDACMAPAAHAVSAALTPHACAALGAAPPRGWQVFQTKCIMEDVNEHEEVVGHYAAYEREHPDRPVVLDVRVSAAPVRAVPANDQRSAGDRWRSQAGHGVCADRAYAPVRATPTSRARPQHPGRAPAASRCDARPADARAPPPVLPRPALLCTNY